MPSAKATEIIPSYYRFPLTTLESAFAFVGAISVLTNPGNYLSTLTHETITTVQPAEQFIYTQLAGGWLYISFTEMVILRLVDDVRVWRFLCAGILCSDLLYTHSIAQAFGGWGEWVKVSEWTRDDWVVTVTTWPFLLIRVAIVLGVGFKKTTKAE